MNERIRELAEQCWEESQCQPAWFNQEKFAELIVRECIDICYNHPARIPSNNWQGVTVPLDIAQRLEEHFGVEK